VRKLKRSVIRHTAEKSEHKTIKLFRYLWKESRVKKNHIAVKGSKKTPVGNSTTANGKQVKQKSLLRRTAEKALKKVGI